VGFDPARDYPLGSQRADLVRTPSGLPLEEVTLEALRAGRLASDDIRATAETLRHQAAVADAAGRGALAENLARAAELAAMPDEALLEIYTALRPRRSTAAELENWADRLESEFAAPLTAAFVREAREAYAARRLLAGERAAV
jgi:propanediol dehydratase small subunit